uniref:Uncharacterized protein n=1 Tax=Anguilla anguilla TaxID=7936 RepID=A0A0E9SV78_ANGAN
MQPHHALHEPRRPIAHGWCFGVMGRIHWTICLPLPLQTSDFSATLCMFWECCGTAELSVRGCDFLHRVRRRGTVNPVRGFASLPAQAVVYSIEMLLQRHSASDVKSQHKLQSVFLTGLQDHISGEQRSP